MISDEIARQLHDRDTRGGALSADERKALENWYSAQDEAEAKLLAVKKTAPSLEELRSKVDSALSEANEITNGIRRLFSENDLLRDENTLLRRRLEARSVSQPA